LGIVYQYLATKADERRFPPLGKSVDVGGHRLHIYGVGEMGSVVVMHVGLTLYGRQSPNRISIPLTPVSKRGQPKMKATPCRVMSGETGWPDGTQLERHRGAGSGKANHVKQISGRHRT
jgi:hypothetical protein